MKEKQAPADPSSFAEFIRSLNERISRMQVHLRRGDWHDRRTLRRLESMITLRAQSLQYPPEGVPAELVKTLKEEVTNG